MKRIMLSVCAAFVLVTASQAQVGVDSSRHHRKGQMERRHHREDAFKSLNLTEEQKAKFKALNEENRKQMAELKKNDNITVKEWKSKMEALRKDHREQVQSLLTPEQKAQLEKSRKERTGRMSERSKDRGERMQKELGLTNEQSAKLKSSREAVHQKVKAIREDQSLTEDVKKQKTKELMQQQRESFRSILTEEQLKKLDEQKKQRTGKRKIV